VIAGQVDDRRQGPGGPAPLREACDQVVVTDDVVAAVEPLR
jgi:hypothetical protein